MKLIHNTGTDRVIDLIRQHLKRGSQLGCVTPTFSLFAFAELIESLSTLEKVQLILPAEERKIRALPALTWLKTASIRQACAKAMRQAEQNFG